MDGRVVFGFILGLVLAMAQLGQTEQAQAASSLDFSGGFAGAGGQLALNGSAKIDGDNIQLTNDMWQAGSAFAESPVNVAGSFATEFDIALLKGTTPTMADGITFTIQREGSSALGDDGGGLGYAGIPDSLAIKFDIFQNDDDESANSTGMYLNGADPYTPAVNLDGTGIDLHSQHPFHVKLIYAHHVLTQEITDTVTNATFNHSYNVDIPAEIGGDTAYVGFTGGTGLFAADQLVKSWTFGPWFEGVAGQANCQGVSVSALAREYGGMARAADDMAYESVRSLQAAIREFCKAA